MQIQVYSFRDVILAFVSVVASLFISVSNAGAIQVQEDEIREAIESIKGVQPGGKAHDQAIKAMQVLSRANARAGGQH